MGGQRHSAWLPVGTCAHAQHVLDIWELSWGCRQRLWGSPASEQPSIPSMQLLLVCAALCELELCSTLQD